MTHKPFKSIDEQISLLRDEKQLIIDDEETAKLYLQELNYYRLSGYSLTLRTNDTFYKNIKFSDIMQIYHFDRDLKLYILKYLEDIEISLRTHIAYELGKKDIDPEAPVSYTLRENFISDSHYHKFQEEIKEQIKNSREEAFIKHHNRKYNGVLPVWAMVETLSFGKVSSLFSILNIDIKKNICDTYYHQIRYSSVEKLLESLVVLRNLCAHHSRLYNRGLPVKPDFAKWEIEYFASKNYERNEIGNRLFFRLPVIMRLSYDNITEKIISDINILQNKYPFVDLKHYGFKKEWKEILKTLNEKYK
ncbi:MAG: Abi family protein [Firmicutes bacterium]|jgi:abortive infection bacteriophage resistance protein|nr:Abi family protein [Bacillota bacterium]